jgi:putative ABC transport system ATP-binding protein
MRKDEGLVRAEDLKKFYEMGKVWALNGVSLEIKKGEFVSVMGPSGCGKSTLLHMIGGVDRPTSGKVLVGGRNLAELGNNELAEFRRNEIGIIFQSFNLIQTLSALENVLVPIMPFGNIWDGYGERAKKLLTRFGIGDRIDNKPSQLSGGQNQRVAIARALINEPALLLADEPTGNLDSKNGAEIMELLSELNKKEKTTIVLITHDQEVASFADRKIRLRDGRII